jgi:hypothetical protein
MTLVFTQTSHHVWVSPAAVRGPILSRNGHRLAFPHSPRPHRRDHAARPDRDADGPTANPTEPADPTATAPSGSRLGSRPSWTTPATASSR